MQEKIWELHCSGLCNKEIAKKLKVDVEYVHDTIVMYWSLGRSCNELRD